MTTIIILNPDVCRDARCLHCIAHNFTDKSLAFFKKSQNESPNGEKKITSEQPSRHDMKF